MIRYFHRDVGDDSKETVLEGNTKMRQLLRQLRKKEYALGLHVSIADLARSYEQPREGPSNSRPIDLSRQVEENVAYLVIGCGSKQPHGAQICMSAMQILRAYAVGFGDASKDLMLSLFVLNNDSFNYEVSEYILKPDLYIAVYLAEPGNPDPFKAVDNKESLLRALTVFPL